jgi:hypothetical protein
MQKYLVLKDIADVVVSCEWSVVLGQWPMAVFPNDSQLTI